MGTADATNARSVAAAYIKHILEKDTCPKCGTKLKQTFASLSLLIFKCKKCGKVYYVD